MPQAYDEIIAVFPLFAGYTGHGARGVLERGEIRTIEPGQLLFREQDPCAEVLLVLSGRLEVFVHRQGRDMGLTESGPGAILGEIGVLCGIPRSASVRAINRSVVLQWSAKAFRSMLLSDATLSERIFRQALRTVIDKERTMIEQLVAAQGG